MATEKQSTTKKKTSTKGTATAKKKATTATKTKKGSVAPAAKMTEALQDRVALKNKMEELKSLETVTKKRVSLNLTENQAQVLKILAKAHECSVSDLVGNELLISYLFYNKEDYEYLIKNAPKVIEQAIIGN